MSKKDLSDHKTTLRMIKCAHIDTEMCSTIDWLNSFDGVYTLFCCQGDKNISDSTYVMFHCWEIFDLQRIAESVYYHGTITVETRDGHLRYILRFNSIKTFRNFKRKMGFDDAHIEEKTKTPKKSSKKSTKK